MKKVIVVLLSVFAVSCTKGPKNEQIIEDLVSGFNLDKNYSYDLKGRKIIEEAELTAATAGMNGICYRIEFVLEAKAVNDLFVQEGEDEFPPSSMTEEGIASAVKEYTERLKERGESGACLRWGRGIGSGCLEYQKPYTQEQLASKGKEREQEMLKTYSKKIKKGERMEGAKPDVVAYCQNYDVKSKQWRRQRG